MLVFALLAAGIGLVLTALSLLLPRGQGPVGLRPSQAPVSDTPGGEGNPDRADPDPPADATSGQPTVLRLVGLPLLSSGLLGATLLGLERPFVTALGFSLALGLPVGLVAALILGRALTSKG